MFLIAAIGFGNAAQVLGQDGIGIGIAVPDNNAIVHIESTTQGFLLPRYDAGINTSTNQRSHPVTAEAGMIYYDKSGNNLALYDGVASAWAPLGFFPVGAIAMWEGSTPPSGWAICNGTNGTPDLRGKFIVGHHSADADYDVIGEQGGASTVTITEAQLPAHSHALSDPGHTHVASTRHAHSYTVTEFTSTNPNLDGMVNDGGSPSGVDQLLTSAASFTGTVGIGSAGTGITLGASGGGGQPHDNLPPYYILAFIMRVN
jgi:microcystin-dependent protein